MDDTRTRLHTNTEVTRSGLEERVLGRRLGLAARPKGRCGGLLSGLGLRGLVIERDARLAIVPRFKEQQHDARLEPRKL